jgi:hypothetical protein
MGGGRQWNPECSVYGRYRYVGAHSSARALGFAMEKPLEAPDDPRAVFLFSGHMVDTLDRKPPRFPADKVAIADAAIRAMLDRLEANGNDLAVCGAACGGDLLFAQAALARNVSLELYIPFDEQTFLAKSVSFANADWCERYELVKRSATLHVMPNELGPLPDGVDAYERTNVWMLEAASRFGTEKVDFVCLWNGEGGDGPGGTQHLMNEVRKRSGRVHWLDTTKLWVS